MNSIALSLADQYSLLEVDRSFEHLTKNKSINKVLKVCFASLNSLYSETESSLEKSRSQTILKNTDKFNLLPDNSPVFAQDVIFALWSELLDLDNDLKVEKKFNILNSFSNRSVSKYFFPKGERSKLLKHVREHFQLENVNNQQLDDTNVTTKKKEILLFIQESLEEIGMIETVPLTDDESDDDQSPTIQSHSSILSIRFDSYTCEKYGIFYFQNLNPDLGNYKNLKGMSVFDSILTKLCVKVYEKEYFTSENNALEQYSTRMITYHLIKIGRLEDANGLLKSSEFFKERVRVTKSIRVASHLHARDSFFLHQSLSNNENVDEEYLKSDIMTLFTTLKKIVSDMKGVSATDRRDIGAALYVSGLKLERIGWKIEASQFFEAALEYQLTQYNEHDIEKAFTLRRLGKYHVGVGNYKKGVEYYETSLKIENNHYGKFHHRVAETVELLAVAHLIMEQYEYALELFQELLHIKQVLFGDESFDVAFVQKELGCLHFKLKKYQDALQYFSAAQIIARYYHDVHITFHASLSFWLGRAYSKLKNYNFAIKYYDDSLKMGESCNTAEDIESVYEAKGFAYYQLGNLTESIYCYKRASILDENFTGYLTPNDIKILCQLASVVYMNGQVEEALNIFQQALVLYKSEDLYSINGVCTVLKSVAYVYENNNETEKAHECYLEIFEHRKKYTLDKSYQWIAEKVKNLGYRANRIGSIDHAAKYFLEAINLYGQIMPNHDAANEEISLLQQNLAIIFQREEVNNNNNKDPLPLIGDNNDDDALEDLKLDRNEIFGAFKSMDSIHVNDFAKCA